MNRVRTVSAGLGLTLAGCFSPNVATDTGSAEAESSTSEADATTPSSDSSADGTGTSGGSDLPETGDSDVGGTDTSDETKGQTGPVVELTVNGSTEPATVAQASEVVVEATAVDVDGSIESVDFFLDGEPLDALVESDGNTHTVRFIISGDDDDGTHIIEAVATDDEDLTGGSSVNVQFDLPGGGLIEAWSFDNGEGGSVLGLHPTPDGDQLVWTGQVFVDGDQDMRIDRVVGPAWQGNATNSDDQGSDVHPLPDGGYIAASAAGDAFALETRLRRYSANGTEMDSALFDGSDNGESNWPLGVELDNAGDYYVLGAFVGPDEFESFLLKSNTNLTQDWKRSLTTSPETDGTPFVYDFDLRGDGQIALAGSDNSRMWIAILDSDGQVEDQLTLVSEFDQSVAYDVTWTPTGEIVVAGATNDAEGWARFVRMYDDALLEQWTSTGAATGSFAMAITADDHGHIIVAASEDCTFNGTSRFEDCRLVLRSYGEGGELRWQHTAEDGGSEFLGPLLFRPGAKADVEVDRFGYVYVSAFHERSLGGGATRPEWWAEQHHP